MRKRVLGIVLMVAMLALFGCARTGPPAETADSPAAHGATADGIVTTGEAAPAPTRSPQPLPPQCLPEPRRLCPVDEGPSDASFVAFRQQMQGIVFRQDADSLMDLVDPKVRTSFGDGGGIAQFRKQWRPDDAGSGLWEELAQILALGGTFQKGGEQTTFWAPYVYSAWPEQFDAFESVAATGPRVAIRAEPRVDGRILSTVGFDILELAGDAKEPEGWRRVKTAEGLQGWVSAHDARSPIGYRASFVKSGGRWRLNALVAGD